MSKTFDLLIISLNELINDLEKNNGKNLKRVRLHLLKNKKVNNHIIFKK